MCSDHIILLMIISFLAMIYAKFLLGSCVFTPVLYRNCDFTPVFLTL